MKKRNGVSLVTWLRRLSGEGFTGAATRGVAGGTVAGMDAGVGETEQNRNFRFTNPELPVSKPGTSGFKNPELSVSKPETSGFWGKTDSILERPKLKFLHNNLKFGQNKSCRGRKDLQH